MPYVAIDLFAIKAAIFARQIQFVRFATTTKKKTGFCETSNETKSFLIIIKLGCFKATQRNATFTLPFNVFGAVAKTRTQKPFYLIINSNSILCFME